MTVAAPPRARTPGAQRWSAHLPFALLLAGGAALRVVAMVAYQPALFFPDSFGYLGHASFSRLSVVHPMGYPLFLWPFVHVLHSIHAIAGAQHLLGLSLAVVGYVFLLRRGLPRWAATLAMLPVLLDPLQLVLEQYVLSDVLFEALLVFAVLLLLRRRRPPGLVACVVSGLLVAAATLTRGAGSLALVAFVVAVVCLRTPWRRVVALVLAGVLPVVGYAAVFEHQHPGHFAVVTAGPRFLHARLLPLVRCDEVWLPAYERPLCPKVPVRDRSSIDWYMWHTHPVAHDHVARPPGMTKMALLRDFDQRVVRAEPKHYATSIGRQFVKGFSWSRQAQIRGRPAGRWLFHTDYWILPMLVHRHREAPRSAVLTGDALAAASFLTGYRTWLWTPGPLLALLGLLALAATLGLGRSRRSGERTAVGLLLAACAVPLLTAVAVNGFSWRYQLPQIPLLPMAGALGLATLLRGPAPGRPPAEPRRLLEQMTASVVGLPMPARVRAGLAAAADRGWLQPVVAVVTGLVPGAVVGAAAVRSGWAAPATAAVTGVVVAVGTTLTLVVSWVRSRADGVLPAPPGSGGDAEATR
ncbi:MAG TPA: hypothetical protein VFM09_15570 [Marmoricola sp.]|nr:hypothetical protein [Marmoricola sp.]